MGRHQLIPSRHPRDPVPLHCNFRWVPREALPRGRINWNFEAMRPLEARTTLLERCLLYTSDAADDTPC
eukprot:875820-Pyramimonas_sp.AAC.1